MRRKASNAFPFVVTSLRVWVSAHNFVKHLTGIHLHGADSRPFLYQHLQR